MKEIYLGNELGNLTEQDCKAIKEIMDGKSYYCFEVSWSNYAGNCQLIVKTAKPNAEKEAVRTLFLHCLASEFARLAHQNKILEQYVKIKYQHPQGIIMFEWSNRLFFYFDDRKNVEVILGYLKCGITYAATPDGWPVAFVPRYGLGEVMQKFIDKGVEVYFVDLN